MMEQSAPSEEGEEYDLGDNFLNDTVGDDGGCVSHLRLSRPGHGV